MDSETIDAVTDWETVAVEDGYRGLHDLADAEFTGAVTDGLAWAFALNGRVIGVFGGSVEDFEDADLTAYESPDPALPLLHAMRERGGETRAKYYTQEMSLSEADETLRSGSFTGYVRLSENVLSGDYYVVYHGGKSMSVAFVGSSRRLLTGDEAFERANDEVGIYEVIDADVDVVELPDAPEPASDAGSDAPASAGGDRSTADATDDPEEAGDAPDAADAESDAASDETPGVTFDASHAESADADAVDTGAADAGDPGSSGTDAPTASDAGPAEPGPQASASSGDAAPDDTGSDAAASDAPDAQSPETEAADGAAEAETTVDRPRPERDRERDRGSAEAGAARGASARDDAPPEDADDVFSEEEEWREARAIPPLDPTQSESDPDDSASRGRAGAAEAEAETIDETGDAPTGGRERPSPPQSVSRSPSRSSASSSRSQAAPASADSAPRSETADAVADLRERLEKATAARERLAAERDDLEAERDDIAAERDEYRERAERLESRVADLEAEIEDLESRVAEASAGGDASAAPDRTMSPDEALAGTNLFVRYESKADPTLEDAHGGDARRDEVNDNLRVEHHTQFDTEGLRVEGKPFEEFLRDTVEYRFVDWVVRSLLYDVRATRAQSGLQDLYDVIPRIDRAEIDGSVSASTGDGDESEGDAREAESFDVVLWDGRGDPLVVANLNTSRDPATESMVRSLVSDAGAVGEANDSLGAAFYVTASYFEPGALDAVGDATGGGLLSRSKRKSFVKLARKRGFHLCLVEARNREFHVSVPDL